MKIGIISDTHGVVKNMDKAIHYLKECDLIIHAGDNVDDAEGAILVLNTFATTAAATGVGIQVASLYGLDYQALGAVILTIVLIYFSEILPKTIGAT